MRACATSILSIILLVPGGAPARAATVAPGVVDAGAGARPDEAILPAALGDPVAGETLDELRGGERNVAVEVHNGGGVDGNSADGVVSGTNTIAGGAFGTSSGIVTVIQNSGANVLIQNGTSVNVQFVDPTP